MRFTLRGARLVDASLDLARGDITLDRERIVYVGARDTAAADRVLDVSQMMVTPGFIDVHTHGGGGFELHTTNAEQIRAYARWTPCTGVTAFLAGVVGMPGTLPLEQLHAAVAATEEPGEGAEMAGIHMEGPYISPARRGAHALTWLRLPDPVETEQLLTATRGHLRLLTIAPELPGAHAMIARLLAAGVTVSIGHTNATYEQTAEAIALGATHATHCFNAMPPLLQRAPGPLAAIAQAPQVQGELIADGIHVHPAVMQILLKMLEPQRVVVVTDALAAAGLEPGTRFAFADQAVEITGGAARLSDGTLTGSVLTMHQALRNILAMTRVSLSAAVGMLSLNPARAARLDARKGLLQPGYDADLLVFDAALNLQATICRGRLAYAADAWRASLHEAGLPSAPSH